ncbi:MAG TPA: GvpL/GvpF family gas vesicle protein [Gemmatimonadaceae bacterium]|nr:GvpL/GvpF family gas vesicle protein [Gemmatimonadaceae bacterium]
MESLARVYYVYGVVPAQPAQSNRPVEQREAAASTSGGAAPVTAANPPRGLDGSAVSLFPVADVAALVSELPNVEYDPATVESRLADLDWLSPRAIAHDDVVSWASDQGGVIPFPMWVLFRDTPALERGLAPRLAEFHRELDRVTPGREYSVRVFAFKEKLAALSPAVAQLESEIEKATPGQRYLLERKLEGVRQTEAREVSASVSDSIHEELSKLALAATTEPAPKSAAILNAAYLVSRDTPEPFQARLTDLIHKFEPLGFRFEFTGPWPPYHFVGR